MFAASTRTPVQTPELPPLDPAGGLATHLAATGLGERWLLADQAHGVLEVLKFKKTLVDAPEFEARLRRRVDELRALRHTSLAVVRSVEWLDGGEGLGLVSVHVPGRRLSDVLSHARGPAFAYEFIRQVTPGLAALQQVRPGMAHGALTADRVIVMRDGRLVVMDIPLASALESLRLAPNQLRDEIGIAVPDAPAPVPLDPRLDVVQVGFIALSLLLGRPLSPADFRARIPALIEEMSATGSMEARQLRGWLEHALQLTERPFESALDALEALPPPVTPAPAPTVVAFRSEKPGAAAMPPAPAAVVPPPEPVVEAVEQRVDTMVEARREEAPVEAAAPAPARKRVRLGVAHWIAIGLAVAASVEGAAIAGLLTTRADRPAVPHVTIAAPAWPAAPAPAASPAGQSAEAIPPATAAPSSITVPPPTVPSAEPAVQTPEAVARPKPGGQVGGVRVTAPFEAQVLEGGALVGSTAGPIALAEGDHDLEIVNESVGLRARQRVTVRAGVLTTVPLTVPPGRVNINAAPWASVWIDGTAAGDTPLANVSLPAGSHEFVFRHPQLGEQRLVAIVKADAVTRVSASFQR